MRQVLVTFREALAAYGRHFRAFALTSGLLLVPLTAIELGRALMVSTAPHVPMAGWSEKVLLLAQGLAAFFTLGALALLGADSRIGGSWGWRDAWARVFQRARPILTGNLACLAVTAISFAMVFVLVMAVVNATATPSRTMDRLATPLIALVVIVMSPLFTLLGPVTAIERTGGGRALSRVWKLLTGGFARRTALLAAANLPTLVGVLLPTSPWSVAASTLVCCAAYPFISLVTLSVYREAREQRGDTDADLRADLNAA